MLMGRIISGFRPTPLLMGRILFNSNRVFSGLSLFSKIQDEFKAGSGIVTHVLPRLYFKNIFYYYFILYFNINNNNYY